MDLLLGFYLWFQYSSLYPLVDVQVELGCYIFMATWTKDIGIGRFAVSANRDTYFPYHDVQVIKDSETLQQRQKKLQP